jgi:hypothetical protein
MSHSPNRAHDTQRESHEQALGPLTALGEGQKPEGAGGETGGRRGLAPLKWVRPD